MKNHHTQPTSEEDQSLYAKRQKIYSRRSYGLFSNLKTLSGFFLLGIYYLLPWLLWDGRQAILFDLPARKFYLFGLVLWPQDLIYLAFLLIIAALTLFFFTTLAGRLWCGFACPQTIWTDVFIWMERLVEGDRTQQIKLDKAPMSGRKFLRKTTKHTLWLIFSLATGLVFVGYFTPIRELILDVIKINLSGWETFWLFFYSLAIYGNAGWLREQVCIYMCPYARFQSAMFDKDTMIIAYDEKRGELRGARKRGENYQAKGLGECINCTLCVQVCPTGIDIRDGLQYQCISCSACIDACNSIMDKMGYPRQLVRYTTENMLEGKPTQVLRPRILVYASFMLAILIGIGQALSNRMLVQLDVIRDRNSLFQETEAGLIENVYTLKVMNMDNQPHTYEVSATGIEGLKIVSEVKITVEPGDMFEAPVRLIVAPNRLPRYSTKVKFTVTAIENPELTITEEARFVGPLVNNPSPQLGQ